MKLLQPYEWRKIHGFAWSYCTLIKSLINGLNKPELQHPYIKSLINGYIFYNPYKWGLFHPNKLVTLSWPTLWTMTSRRLILRFHSCGICVATLAFSCKVAMCLARAFSSVFFLFEVIRGNLRYPPQSYPPKK